MAIYILVFKTVSFPIVQGRKRFSEKTALRIRSRVISVRNGSKEELYKAEQANKYLTYKN